MVGGSRAFYLSRSTGSTPSDTASLASVRSVTLASPASTFCQCRQCIPASWATASSVSPEQVAAHARSLRDVYAA